jgi:phosphatidylglycerol:prolipoprotein diacylglycerol transferase
VHSSFLQLGHLHIPLYGICAAVGLMAALTLSQMTARLVRLNTAAVWDAGLAMVLAALLFSRVLLVIGSWKSFLMSPLLVLALPSLNDTGILLTAIFTIVYLRWKKLPLLGFLDAMVPCFALVWAFLSLGELLAGTRDGMPTQSPLAMSDGMMGNVQPVELYTLVVALVLCGVLIRWLPRRRVAGLGFGLWLILAGAAMFLLDFLRLPAALFATAMLDPEQWLGLMMMIVGAALFVAMPTVPPVTAEKEVSDAV